MRRSLENVSQMMSPPIKGKKLIDTPSKSQSGCRPSLATLLNKSRSNERQDYNIRLRQYARSPTDMHTYDELDQTTDEFEAAND